MSRYVGRWWREVEDRFRCELCPRRCLLSPGQRGFCFGRRADTDGIVSTSYGRAGGFCIDPIEKKPLHHFHPGSAVLSLGTSGCNLGCHYCQNWDPSSARQRARQSSSVSPREVAQIAVHVGAASVALTYNEPVVYAEYAIDIAHECHREGVHAVAVTNGYVEPGPRRELFAVLDAANIELKGYDDDLYRKLCAGHRDPVLDTIAYVANETDVWLELSTVLIPGYNDATAQVKALVRWVRATLGADVPVHFGAFFPAYKMLDVPATPLVSLLRARHIALGEGLEYVYIGNVQTPQGNDTWCPSCGARAIERCGFAVVGYGLDAGGACRSCGHRVPGEFDVRAGTWGNRRVPVTLAPAA